ncbi:hypothetical protein AK812_SmicGene43590 [Symbiodinium microadriaticum]|uniref:Uncharacterized protein n=1 Tax=Symbiodinium microadriaticum TaxID=2951 RepID=A0A1Q9C0M4_SYMMI|nr:hypothetical protein AK812_SmicGene43590 [Symbiodinium microadriaticum]
MRAHITVVQTYNIAMTKRGFKLLAVAVPILVGRSFIAPFGIPRGHKCPSRTTRWASFEAEKLAQYLEPFATLIGTSLKEIAQGVRDANKNRRSISKQKSLVDIDDAQAHAEHLAKILVESTEKSEKARNIFFPDVSLPLIPVTGTAFQHLVSNVLSDVTLTGVSSIHAEPGVGKSVAVGLAMLEWAQDNPKSITVLVSESLEGLTDAFKVKEMRFVPRVTKLLFQILSDAGVRLQLVLDNVFDKNLGDRDGQMLMSLARAAHGYGQVIVVTQSEAVAKEVADLNGARTRSAPQQNVSVTEYRWNRMQASQLLLCLNATEKLKVSNKPHKTNWWRWWRTTLRIFKKETIEVGAEVEKAMKETEAEFRQDDVLISKTLESARLPDGGWTPVVIKEFLLSGKKPVLAVSAIAGTGTSSAPSIVWVRELIRKDCAV